MTIVDKNVVFGNIMHQYEEDIDAFTELARKIVSPTPVSLTEDEHNVVAFLHLAGMQLGMYTWQNNDTSKGFKGMIKEYLDIIKESLREVRGDA